MKAIIKDLEGIKANMDGLSLIVLSTSQYQQNAVDLVSGRETHSFIEEEVVVMGREKDKNAVMKMLLDSNHGEENVSIIPIVGIGGLGKTTLAQICFNDMNVKQCFDLMGWVCISETSDLKEQVKKIFRSVSTDVCSDWSFETLQSRLRDAIKDKKYLLVLDDVWDDNRERWFQLKQLLSGKQGSKIIVTTRSVAISEFMNIEPYNLGGLSEEMSWALFKGLTFRKGQEESNPEFTSIGKEILKKCANVPLVIRTMASLLHSKSTLEQWMNFKNVELRVINSDESDFMSTLKLSYDNLPPHLKQCFAYCSLFPKDYEFDTESLIWLWMAQGFVKPKEGQTLENVGYDYFSVLLTRCFFHEVTRNPSGTVVRCKMHDLMHDLACEVGDDCLQVVWPLRVIDENIRYVSFHDVGSFWKAPSWLVAAKGMRSLYVSTVFRECDILNINSICSRLRSLRALVLSSGTCSSLPSSIGEMKHLRYLKVSVSSTFLPKSITRLPNLQTLDLRGSEKLEELPSGFNKLTNLRHLLIQGTENSDSLIDMPPRFDVLSSLKTLDRFIVGSNNGLNALANLNLVGELGIVYRKIRANDLLEARACNLKDKKLNSLVFDWVRLYNTESDSNEALEFLQPPSTLEKLTVRYWKGVIFPCWGLDVFPCPLPFLVSVQLEGCSKCQLLPPFSQLPLLKCLHLISFYALEYVDNGSGREEVSTLAYFPSLESLELGSLSALKRWRSHMNFVHFNHQLPLILPRLSKLSIRRCRNLMSMPVAPRLESLLVRDIHEKQLTELLLGGRESSSSSLPPPNLSAMKRLEVCTVRELQTLSINLCSLESLEISYCYKLISLSMIPPASLLQLKISYCGRLKDISRVLQHLALLEKLDIFCCEELDLGDVQVIGNVDDRVVYMSAWQGLKSLRYLTLRQLSKVESLPGDFGCLTMLESLSLYHLPNLTALPESFGNLTQLHDLDIRDCPQLTGLPESFGNLSQLYRLSISECRQLTSLLESFGNLTQLHSFDISDCPLLASLPSSFSNLTVLEHFIISRCPDLMERCKCPYGEDWPLIHHIPKVTLVNEEHSPTRKTCPNPFTWWKSTT